jgi:V/A-type H+/Na+-transporting ATPase subunit D
MSAGRAPRSLAPGRQAGAATRGLPRVPPGRAGRLWLRGRLATAERALDLLDRKLRILRRERERLDLLAGRTGEELERTCRDAETWLLRAGLLGGQRDLRLAGGGPLAEVSIAWRDTMGVHYPAEASIIRPEPAPPPPACTAALAPAAAAYRAALAAAASHAAATAAARLVAGEVAATQQRLRGIQDRWIPRLRTALAELELSLDEQEQSDNARLRRAVPDAATARRRRP